MSGDSCDKSVQDSKLVRPSAEFQSLLLLAGASKDLFTMKEVMYYLGQYIMQKELFDKTEQHIVHCSHDALGKVLGVHSFSVKEPRILFSLITKNLVAVMSNESSPEVSQQCTVKTEEESVSPGSSRRRRRRSRRSSEPGPSCSKEEEEEEEEQEDDQDEDQEGGRKRRRSDSFSLTFDDSLSWCVIGGLRNDTDCQGQSADTNSTVYEVTIIEAEEDSSDEDPEITKDDYWRCSNCEELNPPLPRNCNRCWKLRQDWLPELSVSRANSASPDHKVMPTKPSVDQSVADQNSSPGPEDDVDVPDGKRSHSPRAPSSPRHPPSSDLLGSTPSPPPCDPAPPPDSKRTVSTETRLPEACVEPCLICQTRPKNGCIVHGRTGHLMACYPCARKLKRRNKLCPVCREPIQSVVLTYLC